MKWSSVCAEQAQGVKPGDPIFTAWVRLAATPVRDVKAIVNPRGARRRPPRRPRRLPRRQGGGGRRCGGGRRRPRRPARGAAAATARGRGDIEQHGRDGAFSSSVRIIGLEQLRTRSRPGRVLAALLERRRYRRLGLSRGMAGQERAPGSTRARSGPSPTRTCARTRRPAARRAARGRRAAPRSAPSTRAPGSSRAIWRCRTTASTAVPSEPPTVRMMLSIGVARGTAARAASRRPRPSPASSCTPRPKPRTNSATASSQYDVCRADLRERERAEQRAAPGPTGTTRPPPSGRSSGRRRSSRAPRRGPAAPSAGRRSAALCAARDLVVERQQDHRAEQRGAEQEHRRRRRRRSRGRANSRTSTSGPSRAQRVHDERGDQQRRRRTSGATRSRPPSAAVRPDLAEPEDDAASPGESSASPRQSSRGARRGRSALVARQQARRQHQADDADGQVDEEDPAPATGCRRAGRRAPGRATGASSIGTPTTLITRPMRCGPAAWASVIIPIGMIMPPAEALEHAEGDQRLGATTPGRTAQLGHDERRRRRSSTRASAPKRSAAQPVSGITVASASR